MNKANNSEYRSYKGIVNVRVCDIPHEFITRHVSNYNKTTYKYKTAMLYKEHYFKVKRAKQQNEKFSISQCITQILKKLSFVRLNFKFYSFSEFVRFFVALYFEFYYFFFNDLNLGYDNAKRIAFDTTFQNPNRKKESLGRNNEVIYGNEV
jgi:hypothetical protein